METSPQETHQSYRRHQFYDHRLRSKPFSLQRTSYKIPTFKHKQPARILLEKTGKCMQEQVAIQINVLGFQSIVVLTITRDTWLA